MNATEPQPSKSHHREPFLGYTVRTEPGFPDSKANVLGALMPWVQWASSEQSVNQWAESRGTLREELEGQNEPSNAQKSQCSLTYFCVPHHQLGIGVLSFEVKQFPHGWSLDPGHTLPFKTQLLLGSVFQPLGSIVSLLHCLLPTTLPPRNRIKSAVELACLLTCPIPNWEGRVHAERNVCVEGGGVYMQFLLALFSTS